MMRFLISLVSLFCFCQISYSQNESNILLPVYIGSKWGYINVKGEMVVQPKYDNASDFVSKGYAIVEKAKKKGVVNCQGREILPVIYDGISISLVSKTNKNIPYNFVFICKEDNKYGCADSTGKLILACEWQDINVKDLLLVKSDSGSSLYNPVFFNSNKPFVSDSIVISVDWQTEYYVFHSKYRKVGVFDINGNVIIPPDYDDIKCLPNNVFRFRVADKYGLMDSSATINIEPEYDEITEFRNNLALVKKNNLTGLINKNFEFLLEPLYTKVSITEDRVKAKAGQKLIILEIENGKVIESNEYENVQTIFVENSLSGNNGFNAGLLSDSTYVFERWFYSSNKWGLLNANGDTLIKPTFDKVHSNRYDNYSIVENKKTGYLGFTDTEFYSKSVYGIVDHESGITIISPKFLALSLNDYRDSTVSIVRCYGKSGYNGYFEKNNRYKYVRCSYIDKGDSGVYRILFGGKISYSNYPTAGENFLSTVQDFYSLLILKSFGPRAGRKIYSIGGKWGFFIGDSLFMNPLFQYESKYLNNGSIVKSKDKWGVVDRNMSEIVPIQYDSVSYAANSNNRFYKLHKKNNKIGVLYNDGRVLTEMIYDDIGRCSEGIMTAKKNLLYGFIDINGKELTDFIYSNVSDFSNDVAAVKIKSKWGFVDREGNIVIEPQYRKVESFGDDLAYVTKTNMAGFIDKTGNIVLRIKCISTRKFQNGVAWIKTKDKFGLIDKKGNWIIKPKYKNVNPYDNKGALTIVYNKKYGVVDNLGNIVVPLKYDKIQKVDDSGKAIVLRKRKYGFLDENGKVLIEPKFDKVNRFFNEYAIVLIKEQYCIINQTGNIAKNLKLCLNNYTSNIVFVDTLNDNEYYFSYYDINWVLKNSNVFAEDTVTKLKYYLRKDRVNNDILVSENDSLDGCPLIFKSDKKFTFNSQKQFRYDFLKTNGEGTAKYRNNIVFGLADVKGKVVFDPQFEDISFYDENIYKIIKKNSVCYLKMDGAWIWNPKK